LNNNIEVGIVLFRGQGAFEYMLSYGWAILIVVVLGILLFSLGVLNPTSTPTATGFTVMKPVSWSFSGGNEHQSNVTIAFENVAGQSLSLWVTDNETKKSIKFKKGNSVDCYLNATTTPIITDSTGNNITLTNKKIAVPVGGIITISGILDGYGRGESGSNCGGITNAGYRYNVQLVAEDEYLVLRKDIGQITGRFI